MSIFQSPDLKDILSLICELQRQFPSFRFESRTDKRDNNHLVVIRPTMNLLDMINTYLNNTGVLC